jgi:hypothetical protein
MQHPATSGSAFILIAAASSVVWHLFVRAYGVAVLGAALTTVVLFRVVEYLVLGYLEPYFYMAMASSLLPALVIAAGIGLPFRFHRARHAKG